MLGMAVQTRAQMPSADVPRVIYIYDALDGWSYGFSPVIEQLYNRYKNGVYFDVVSGGLAIDEDVAPIGVTAYGIKNIYPKIEEETGIQFGEEFLRKLEEGTMEFNSLPAAIAMEVFELYQPEKVLEYAVAIQNAIYFEGMPPADVEGYASIAETFDIDHDAFIKFMKQDVNEQSARADFLIAFDLGVYGYPAVVLKQGKEFTILSEGYVDYETLSSRLEEALEAGKKEPSPDKWYDEQ